MLLIFRQLLMLKQSLLSSVFSNIKIDRYTRVGRDSIKFNNKIKKSIVCPRDGGELHD